MSEHPPVTGQKVAAMVGAIAGLVFILVNAGPLPDSIAAAVRGLGVVAFMAVTLTVLGRGGAQRLWPAPDERTLRIYWSMVILEVILLPVGATVLSWMHHPELSAPWVALIVGVHFLPSADAFRMPEFQPLAWTLIALALISGVFAVGFGAPPGAFVAGVLSGVALLVFALSSGRTVATV
jgi:hypothetical protein